MGCYICPNSHAVVTYIMFLGALLPLGCPVREYDAIFIVPTELIASPASKVLLGKKYAESQSWHFRRTLTLKVRRKTLRVLLIA